ncbi:hypothetical protein CJP74_03335 [Psittacicella melopsittaci]|uniref:Uncharacterized protein n=1 Tax=Psittacicella melopsittaci TaxID=2028576 RepID=A0A3A1Y6U4_9GAMM|nr:HU family DNA-binding protein [Psittacicella melopsittaci]RIY33026.1 hypothetical protein CJP74_03335 [Psittacicella melopsittaci]
MSKVDLEVNDNTVDSLLTTKELVELVTENIRESDNALFSKLGKTELDATTKALLNAWSETVEEVILSGQKVRFSNFGSFSTKYYPERSFTNPLTKKEGVARAHVNVAFKPSSVLKDAISSNHVLVKAHEKLAKSKSKK